MSQAGNVEPQTAAAFKKVISVCTPSDLDMWKFAHPYILKNIESEVYELIVPDAYLSDFLHLTDSRYVVSPISRYIDLQTNDSLDTAIRSKIKTHPEFYTKQILNVEASIRCLNGDDAVLFLAPDMVPINKIGFEWGSGSNSSSVRSEGHTPVCSSSNGLDKSGAHVPFNFMSRCFSVKVKCLIDYCHELESINNIDWKYAYCTRINDDNSTCLERFEAVDRYLLHKYHDLVDSTPPRWNKFGNSLFDIHNVDIHNCMCRLSKYCDFISFDKEDVDAFKGVNVGCGNIRIEKTYLGNRMFNVDIDDLPSVEAVIDCNDPKWFFSDAKFEHVIINNVIEHCDSVLSVMLELDRILMPGGVLQFEIPFIGSFNHGTDITHVRGFTFNSFDFLFNKTNYLYRYQERNPFNYKLIRFWRENVNENGLFHEAFTGIPAKSDCFEWLHKIARFEIPGTFGYIFQKLYE